MRRSSRRIVWLSWWACRCCKKSVRGAASDAGVAVPDSTRLEVGGSAREDGSGDALTGLASIHDTLGYGGEVAGDILAICSRGYSSRGLTHEVR